MACEQRGACLCWLTLLPFGTRSRLFGWDEQAPRPRPAPAVARVRGSAGPAATPAESGPVEAGGWRRAVRTPGEEGLGEEDGGRGVGARGGQPPGQAESRRGAAPGRAGLAWTRQARERGRGLCPLPQCMLHAGVPALGAVSARGGQAGLTHEGPSPCQSCSLSSGPSWTEGARSGGAGGPLALTVNARCVFRWL